MTVTLNAVSCILQPRAQDDTDCYVTMRSGKHIHENAIYHINQGSQVLGKGGLNHSFGLV